MSDDKPKITVTRGKRNERSKRREKASAGDRLSSGLSLPGPGAVVSGFVRGVRTAWWAGLGLLDVTRSAGAQVFEALVEEGKSWEQVQRERREQRAEQVRRLTEEGDMVEAAEERIRDEVNEALRRIGAPHRDEVDALRDQIDALNAKVARLRDAVSDAQAETEE